MSAGAGGIIYIVTPVRSRNVPLFRSARCVSLSPPFLLSYSIYRLSPAPILTAEPAASSSSSLLPPPSAARLLLLLLALFAFHVRLRRSSRFMRSLSIFHDSMFYCLYESFYPTFLLARDISLRSVTFYA